MSCSAPGDAVFGRGGIWIPWSLGEPVHRRDDGSWGHGASGHSSKSGVLRQPPTALSGAPPPVGGRHACIAVTLLCIQIPA